VIASVNERSRDVGDKRICASRIEFSPGGSAYEGAEGEILVDVEATGPSIGLANVEVHGGMVTTVGERTILRGNMKTPPFGTVRETLSEVRAEL
jgi:hypothetical protein